MQPYPRLMESFVIDLSGRAGLKIGYIYDVNGLWNPHVILFGDDFSFISLNRIQLANLFVQLREFPLYEDYVFEDFHGHFNSKYTKIK